MVTLIITSS